MANVYSLDGKVKGKVELPKAFKTAYRPDIIQKVVVAEQQSKRQRHSTNPNAGFMTSGDYFGSRRNTFRQTINKGQSRLPRLKTGGGGLGRVIRISQSRGGMTAHHPVGKDFHRKINRKEIKLALNSAIAATTDKQLVASRSHKCAATELPIVFEDRLQELKRTKDVVSALEAVGLAEELASGKKKKMLLVVGQDKGLLKACASLSGVDASQVSELTVELLAPGTHAGRLTIFTESAIKALK